ncbi:methyltransferase domain-containing protein [Nocardia terpenica]|uniref:class I SAM-dependent DNA methyltransferase n=1 Tax=Nocardia terpenica TaxID=455432 RepID=UPI001895C414|nr:class I SAM-dependent methyltransferase [Nocardia terpenica]MBF6061801.1 methyltransferase domain-containing protein [Nocardia terpenica]MBF6106398.1 methyltransferase domain-containing protein [Nocardia terpenica]MBF6110221.1 methyltransferase domain-containing protein [Nocardia terpenica]MBF6120942.1 methyltransferase domain-containing protein [Nocardia terpenica]MBF6151557.1 methyltransferase domain-containing protein [Nocardia terpenica]
MPTFADFDRRNYRTVDVATGYDGWAPTYEQTVMDEMDLALLDRLRHPRWNEVRRAADLGCGTGRTGAWLRGHGTIEIDGVDLSAGMLERARERGVHATLAQGDVRDTGLASGAYDLVISSLIDEHLPELAPFYAEARRLAAPGGTFVLVSYHPQFMMVTGMPTHYTGASGEPLAISTHLHLFSEHVHAGVAAGWRLTEAAEAVVDDAWLAAKPKWSELRGQPFTMALVWTLPE